MDREQAKAVLQSNYKDLVNLALSYVNLPVKEETVLSLRCIKRYTQEETAEHLNTSVTSVKTWEKQALNRCAEVWSGIGWIGKLMV